MIRTGLALLFVLVAFGLDARVALRGGLEPVPPMEMERARRTVIESRKPGDIVVHSPLLSLSELAHLGDLHASPHVPSKEARASRRVIVIDRRVATMFGFGKPTRVENLGEHLVVRWFEPARDVPRRIFELKDSISESTMEIERAGKRTRCALRFDAGFRCSDAPEWVYVGTKQLVIDGRESICVWAHPMTDAVVVLRIPPMLELLPDHRVELTIEVAMADGAVRGTPDGAVVRTDVMQGEESLGHLVAPNRIGWTRGSWSLEPGLSVELRITTPRDGRRHHCVNAAIVEHPAKPHEAR